MPRCKFDRSRRISSYPQRDTWVFLSKSVLSFRSRVCFISSRNRREANKGEIHVAARATIEQASQHPDSLQYIQQLEDYSKYQRQESVEEISPQRPAFIRPLQDLGELQEGRNAHFEAQLTPVSDPTMKVEWYKDGRPITASKYLLWQIFSYKNSIINGLDSKDHKVYRISYNVKFTENAGVII